MSVVNHLRLVLNFILQTQYYSINHYCKREKIVQETIKPEKCVKDLDTKVSIFAYLYLFQVC